MHDFKSSLDKGAAGEVIFAEVSGLLRLDGRKHDFVDKETGETYELKTDSYDMAKTKNFFIETWSDAERRKEGGPRQALRNGSCYWVYFFVKNRTYFIFETAALCKTLEQLYKKHAFKEVSIPNKSWTTVGLLVPRELLTTIAKEVVYE